MSEFSETTPTPHKAPDLAELRRLAEACPMPDNDPDTLSEWYGLEDLTERNYPIPPIDAAYIAAASPDVVLGLLDRLTRHETPDVAELRRWLGDMQSLATREGVYNGNRAVLDIIARVEPLLDALAADADKWQRAALTLQGDRDALRAELAHMTEARDNARAEVERLAALVTEVRATAEHCEGRVYADGSAAILRLLDGGSDS